MSLVEEDVYAEIPKTIRGVVLSGGSYHAGHPIHHGREVHLVAEGLDTVLFGMVYEVRDPGALDERLGRDSAGVEAVTAEPAAFYKGDFRPKGRRSGRRDQSRGPATDNDQVIP